MLKEGLPTLTEHNQQILEKIRFHLQIQLNESNVLTLSEGVLFDVFSADGNVFEEALSGVSAALLHWVLGTQGENSQVLERQQQFDQGQVQLLSKDLTHLIALILHERQADRDAISTHQTRAFPQCTD